MALLLRFLLFISLTACLNLCLASTSDILQAVKDMQDDLDFLKQAHDQYMSDITRRDPQFWRPPDFGRRPFRPGGIPWPHRPPPPPPAPSIDFEELAALIEILEQSLQVLIDFLRNNLPLPPATTSLTLPAVTSTSQFYSQSITAITLRTSTIVSGSSSTDTSTDATISTGSTVTTGLGILSSDSSTTLHSLSTSATITSIHIGSTLTESSSTAETTTTGPSTTKFASTGSQSAATTETTTTDIEATTSSTDSATDSANMSTESSSTAKYTYNPSESISTTVEASTTSGIWSSSSYSYATTTAVTAATSSDTTLSESSDHAATTTDDLVTTTGFHTSMSSMAQSSTTDRTTIESTTEAITTTESTSTESSTSTALESSATFSRDTTTTDSISVTASSTSIDYTANSTTTSDITTANIVTTSSADTSTTETTTSGATSTTSTGEPAPTYVFNPAARNLNLVYFGQTTSPVSLTTVCADDNVDIITIGFVTGFFVDGELNITMNQGSHCWAPNQHQRDAGATGLKDCVEDGNGYAKDIRQCQLRGKKVLISAGGVYSNLTIPDENSAERLANRLWNLFLGGVDREIAPTRPYGDVVLDGFDFDNEKAANKEWLPKVASSLRQLMAGDPSKSYYLTAAPQCPIPDASIPVAEMIESIDFYSVQFYQNPSCQLSNEQGFLDSLQDWSDMLAGITPIPAKMKMKMAKNEKKRARRTTTGPASSPLQDGDAPRRKAGSQAPPPPQEAKAHTKDGKRQTGDEGPNINFFPINNGITSPRLLIGTPAYNWGDAGNPNPGYVDVATYQDILRQVKAKDLPNLAGAMFWDGGYLSTSAQVVDGELVTYADVVRDVLSAP